MDKKHGPAGTGSKGTQSTPGSKVTPDSKPAGEGSDLFTINEHGEYCFGSGCISMRIKPGSGEVRVVVDKNECGSDIAEQLVDSLFGEIVKGAPTVYESKSKAKESK